MQHLWDTLIMTTYKSSLITGGSSGIGLALAKQLIQQGGNICLLARDPSRLNEAKENMIPLINHSDQVIDTLSCDISDFEAVSGALKTWMDKRGTPDLVINSAGITYPGYFQDLDVEIYHQLMEVNYYGTVHVLKTIIPGMIEKGIGTVVNISSQAGFVSVFGYAGYGASKYAVRGLTDALRAEMKPHGINVHIVFPPDTDTPQLAFEEPLKPTETKAIAGNAKVVSAEQVASETLKGLERGRYVIIPGLEGKIFYRLVNIAGNLTYPIMDWIVRKAQKSKIKLILENCIRQSFFS
jgi:3-dehydrosphinganine reductase